LSRPRPSELQDQDQGKTLLGRPLNRLPYIFCNVHKMNPTVCTQSDTTHRCRGADFSFQWRSQDFWMGVGSVPRRV